MKKIFLMIIMFFGCFGCEKKEMEFRHIQWQRCESLMIVAHPDDETIFGGGHLQEKNYLVVCLTNGNHPTRKKEFQHLIKQTGNQGLIFDYPDKTNGKRDLWLSVKENIKDDIKTLVEKKDWKIIVTHNPDGEYGHIHHQMTSHIVTTYSPKKRLYYFGKYYSKKKLPQDLKTLSQEKYQKKEELTKMYKSQKKVVQHLYHILKYENWISYEDWR